MDTIGDAYVAAGWLNSLDPAEATERCAAMIRLSQRLLRVLAVQREVSGQDVRCRIGISKGVVYAGVLGRLQPRYHLFGEPMRIAEQLGSRGAVDSVHVSAPVMEALATRPGPQAPEEVSQAWTGNSSTRAREREREGYPASSEMDWTEVDIAAGDEGNLFVRSSTAPDIRVAGTTEGSSPGDSPVWRGTPGARSLASFEASETLYKVEASVGFDAPVDSPMTAENDLSGGNNLRAGNNSAVLSGGNSSKGGINSAVLREGTTQKEETARQV